MKYNMDEFNFMNNTEFSMAINDQPMLKFKGVVEVCEYLRAWVVEGDLLDTLFRVFLKNKQKDFTLLYLDDKGDILTDITIKVWD